MKKWRKWLASIAVSVSLVVVPLGMASAASPVQTLLYGAASMALAKQQLNKMDMNSQKQMLANTKAKTGVLQDEAYSDRLETIQKNLVHTGLVKREYDVYVNPSEELNAFETIGGVISVNKGMMDALNDDELAFTMCHEMEHGEKKHAINGVLKSIGISTLVDVALGGNADLLDILLGSVAVNYIDNELITMDQEKQADSLGFNILKNTQYNVGGAPSSMQFVYEKYGDMYTEGLKRVISPNNHPQMSSRIQKLAGRMAQWSGNRVQVGGDMVYVNALPVVRPAASGDYSARRRAFLIGGNIARVTHNVYGEAPKEDKVVMEPAAAAAVKVTTDVKADLSKTPSGSAAATVKPSAEPELWNITQSGNDISVNGLRIMTCAAGDDSAAIVTKLTTALHAKPAMVSKNDIQKQNKEWTQKYGYKEKKKASKTTAVKKDTKPDSQPDATKEKTAEDRKTPAKAA
ncbi:MAG: M48 family metalloprotease [Megasphaera sp.]|jgi:Zn-dependent protease with chaperone function|nr:M48 family metalloprotease [Megasphaera sp.]MCH4188683.1 M48 family metalloprotease [Megasphaera sp.]MCH4218553.1 M48 family metalloprotease [Megasphaera sp.]